MRPGELLQLLVIRFDLLPVLLFAGLISLHPLLILLHLRLQLRDLHRRLGRVCHGN